MIAVRFLAPGEANGEISLLSRPLSLWGGYDVHSGTIVDATHPETGRCLAGRILAMTEARGSSSSSSALVEAARIGTAPAAILLLRIDPILLIGSLVAHELYALSIPIAIVERGDWALLRNGKRARLTAPGLHIFD